MVVFSDNEEELKEEDTRKYVKSLTSFNKAKRVHAFYKKNHGGFSGTAIGAL
jgi:hypothetical protein